MTLTYDMGAVLADLEKREVLRSGSYQPTFDTPEATIQSLVPAGFLLVHVFDGIPFAAPRVAAVALREGGVEAIVNFLVYDCRGDFLEHLAVKPPRHTTAYNDGYISKETLEDALQRLASRHPAVVVMTRQNRHKRVEAVHMYLLPVQRRVAVEDRCSACSA